MTMPTPTPRIEELRAWLRLSQEPGLGPAQARLLLATAGLPQEIYAMSVPALSRVVPESMALQLRRPPDDLLAQRIQTTLEWLLAPRHHVLTLADADYPRSLLDLSDPPLLLYVNGDPALLSRPAISIVGSRSATADGVDNARAFAAHLARQGWCVISGMAQGIDAAAHRGALEAGPRCGGTIAILGTGIDIVYPASHRDLAHQIAAQGALVSEFPLGCRALPHQFPRRNRLVAAMGRGVLVVEAARQSGSLITARQALETGREVFAIPGSIHSPLSRGCHALIRQGAKLVESADDIRDELGTPAKPGQLHLVPSAASDATPAAPTKGAAGKSAPAKGAAPEATQPPVPAASKTPRATAHDPIDATVLMGMGYDPVDIDTLQERTQLALPILAARLAALELQDDVVRHPDGRFQRRQETAL